jgi:hypothetical protein
VNGAWRAFLARVIREEHATCSRPDDLAHGFNEFVFVGESACLELRVELPAAHGKLEAASLGGNHDETTDRALKTRQELGRQTDGLRFVVSKCTVFERDIHGGAPYSSQRRRSVTNFPPIRTGHHGLGFARPQEVERLAGMDDAIINTGVCADCQYAHC